MHSIKLAYKCIRIRMCIYVYVCNVEDIFFDPLFFRFFLEFEDSYNFFGSNPSVPCGLRLCSCARAQSEHSGNVQQVFCFPRKLKFVQVPSLSV